MTKKQYINCFIVVLAVILLTGFAPKKVQNIQSSLGDGAGGIITIYNKTPMRLDVTWSGIGCLKYYQGLYGICASITLSPDSTYTYEYGWGVGATWINAGIWDKTAFTHACAPLAEDERRKQCAINHAHVETSAYKNTHCVITGDTASTASVSCQSPTSTNEM
ncbi:MAG: hypothetical protein KAH18_03375 [Psychromonas sp.]|nr:hypothetical protein [Psychromonas sp.]